MRAGKDEFDDIEVTKFMTTGAFIALKADGIADKTSSKFFNVLLVNNFNRHGQSDNKVVNLSKCWGLKIPSDSNESKELIISRIDLGNNEQSMDGAIEYMLYKKSTFVPAGMAFKIVDEEAIRFNRSFRYCIDT